MIRQLEIKGLRCFEHFEVRDLGRVNLLVGTNNCGKTTVLESIQLATSPGDVLAIYKTLRRRGEAWRSESRPGQEADVRRLFHGHELRIGSAFQVEAWMNGGSQSMRAEVVTDPAPDGRGANEGQRELFEDGPTETDLDYLAVAMGLNVTWLNHAKRGTPVRTEFVSRISRQGGVSSRQLQPTYSVADSPASQFISTASLEAEHVVSLFESIVLTPHEELVVDALRIIEPSIERIATGNADNLRMLGSEGRGGMLVRCQGVKHRIPIGSMGDGIWRMLGLALALVRCENGILLVDEIDTGLHYSVMADMWRLVNATAKRLNVQVFATTHSRDCFESLAAICREDVSEGSETTIQRIERDKHVAVSYTEQEIIAAAERGMEVR